MDAIIAIQDTELSIVDNTPLDQNPAAVYLAGLAPTGRRSMRQALGIVASMLSNDRADIFSYHWAGIRFQHMAAIRAKLVGVYKPATANKILCAIRGVLKAAWRWGK